MRSAARELMLARGASTVAACALVACNASQPDMPAASPDAHDHVVLESNLENTAFFVDQHKLGVGKSLHILVNGGAHTLGAEPPGYALKEMTVRGPYEESYPHKFTFLMEDKLASEPFPTAAPVRPVPVARIDAVPSSAQSYGRPAAPQPTAYAIVIGVERYAEGLPPPTGARRDATAIAGMFTQSLGLPSSHVHLDVDEHASKASVERDIEWAKNNVPAGGRVYFYFSGHGSPSSDGTSFLVPFDGDPKYLEQTALPLAKIQRELAATKAKDVILLVDACFSGAGGRSVLPPGARPLMRVREPESSGSVAVFAASGASEISGPTSDGASGLFTHYVIEGITNGRADADGDGAISLQELADWVRPRVAREAERDNRSQTPVLTPGAVPAKDSLVVWGFPQGGDTKAQ